MKNKIVIKKIKELEKVKPRPEWLERSRDILLSQIKPMEINHLRWFRFKNYSQFLFRLFPQQVLEPVGAIVIVLGLFLGSSLIVNATFYSLPGDYLYPIKLTLEKTQLIVTASEENKAGLKIEFAKKRIAEFDKLVLQPNDLELKEEKISLVINKFKKDVGSVQDHLLNLSKKDNTVTKLAKAVDSQVSELIKVLDARQSQLPEALRKEVRIAVSSAEDISLSALKILIDKYQQGKERGETGEAEMIIALLENKIENIKVQLNSLENLEVAELLRQAKELLVKGELAQAWLKIYEAKNLINNFEPPATTDDTSDDTSKELNLENNNNGLILATTTEVGVGSTNSELLPETTDRVLE